MEKNVLTEWLAERFAEVAPRDFYRGIFPAGELEKKGEYIRGKYTGIIVAVTNRKKRNGKRKVYRYSLTDDLDAVETAVNSNDFCLCSPISYAGKQRTAENARMLYAIVVDVDKIRVLENEDTGELMPMGLINLWERHIEAVRRLPKPTYIVSSGSGLHLYYVLEQPLPLYQDIAFELQEYKRELTRLIWHDTIVGIKHSSEVQQEGIYQGFRMPGTITKNGGRAKAFLTGERVTMEYLNSFVGDINKAKKAVKQKKSPKLTEAAEKWPGWYERRIVQKQPRGVWCVNRALYDWWRERIIEGATVGHRYYCLMMLAMYAQKCSYYDAKHNPQPVTREELERDCMGLIDHMESLTNSADNHFGLDDVLDALEAFDDRWTTYPRAAIEYRSGIVIPANKRNGRKQAEHIRLMNYIRDELNGNGDWNRHGNGRKSNAEGVLNWRFEHPDGTIKECIADMGLSQATVYRHWNKKAAEAAGGREHAASSSSAADQSGAAADARRAAEVGKLEQLEQRIKAEIEKQREALRGYEKSAEAMREALALMPDGAEKEKYRRLLESAEEDIAAIKADISGSGDG